MRELLLGDIKQNRAIGRSRWLGPCGRQLRSSLIGSDVGLVARGTVAAASGGLPVEGRYQSSRGTACSSVVILVRCSRAGARSAPPGSNARMTPGTGL